MVVSVPAVQTRLEAPGKVYSTSSSSHSLYSTSSSWDYQTVHLVLLPLLLAVVVVVVEMQLECFQVVEW